MGQEGSIRISRAEFGGNVIMLGCGSIGQAVLPMIGRHLEDVYARLTVLAANEAGRKVAEKCGAKFIHGNLTPGNYRSILRNHVREGDLLLNLSIDISSIDLIRFCADRGVLYVDSSIEPWPDVFDNPMLSIFQRSNFAIRARVLELAEELGAGGSTAVIDHGANPGIVTHFVKKALINLDRALRDGRAEPRTREEWASLAQELNITTIQISERDTQACDSPKSRDEFVNTWSVDGFIDELMQPVELSLGTFEKQRPRGSREHRPGCGSIYFQRPGASTFGRSWVPSIGSFQGMLVTHDEVFSLADYLSIRNDKGFAYRPSVMFVYHPCDAGMLSALELEGSGWVPPPRLRLLTTEIVEGMDELGVLLAGHDRNAYWFGSQLTIDYARAQLPTANATTMQVTAGVISGALWALRNPRRGIVEPEQLDYDFCLQVAAPYLGKLTDEFTDWTPLDGRGKHFPEKLDDESPWQFQNIRTRQWIGS